MSCTCGIRDAVPPSGPIGNGSLPLMIPSGDLSSSREVEDISIGQQRQSIGQIDNEAADKAVSKDERSVVPSTL
jgi:hypothetical protein